MAKVKFPGSAAGFEPLLDGARRKMLLVASTGGHLTQLVRISERWNLHPDSVWMTFDTPQSRALLKGKNVHYVPYIRSRGYVGVLKALPHAYRLLRGQRFDSVVSTGAAIALAVLPLAKRLGKTCFYIESVSRVEGPSLSGRIIDITHSAQLRTQHVGWASDKWQAYPSVLSQFRSAERLGAPLRGEPLRALVTLGTIRPYRFDSAVDALLATGLISGESNWQLGVTSRNDVPGTAWEQVSPGAILDMAREAEVVVTHAGVGTILTLLENGVHPVVLPRRVERGEHVDNHQLQIANLVAELGIATVAEVSELTAEHMSRAAALCTVGDETSGSVDEFPVGL